MGETVSADAAAERLQPRDSIGLPLATGQPGAFMEALGKRDDWEELRIYGALLAVYSEVFSHPNVHYLSGFFGPIERAFRDQGANISFAPADFRRFTPLFEATKPRVMATAASPPDEDGWLSLSLHAGRLGRRAASRGRGPRPPARGRVLAGVPAHVRPPAGASARRAPRRGRPPGRERPGAAGASGPAPDRRRPRHRRERSRLRPGGRDPANRNRLGALDDRRPARGG